MDENNEEKNNDIEIVTGNGSELNISHVYDHIKMDKPNKNEKKQKIIIPENKKKK